MGGPCTLPKSIGRKRYILTAVVFCLLFPNFYLSKIIHNRLLTDQ